MKHVPSSQSENKFWTEQIGAAGVNKSVQLVGKEMKNAGFK